MSTPRHGNSREPNPFGQPDGVPRYRNAPQYLNGQQYANPQHYGNAPQHANGQHFGGVPPYGTAPLYGSQPYGRPPRKQKHTLRNVLLAVSVIFVLMVGGCVALVSSAANEVSRAMATGGTSKGAAPSTGAGTATKKAAAKISVAQQNALRSAKSYVELSGFSRAGLIQQLTSKAGDGYKRADAVYAVDHLKVNWYAEAVQSAKSYLAMSGFSRSGLIAQLSSKAGDQYTVKQATYAANKVGL